MEKSKVLNYWRILLFLIFSRLRLSQGVGYVYTITSFSLHKGNSGDLNQKELYRKRERERTCPKKPLMDHINNKYKSRSLSLFLSSYFYEMAIIEQPAFVCVIAINESANAVRSTK